MSYSLTITESRKNPNYDAEVEKWKQSRGDYFNQSQPTPMVDFRVVQIEVNQREFDAIRRAILSAMEPSEVA